MLRAEDVHGEERGQGQDERHGDIARDVRAAREEGNQPHEVVHEDEEEGREQIGGELAVVGADAGLDDAVHNARDEHLEQGDEAFRSAVCRLVAAVPAGNTEHQAEQDRAVEQQGRGGFGQREVQRPQVRTVRLAFDDLAGMLALRGDAQPFVLGAFAQPRRREAVPAA